MKHTAYSHLQNRDPTSPHRPRPTHHDLAATQDAWKAEQKVWKTETIQRLLEAIEQCGLHQLVEQRSLSMHDSTDFLCLEEKSGCSTEATLPGAEEVDDGQEPSTHVLPDECRLLIR